MSSRRCGLGDYIEAFEAAQEDGPADLARFLPAAEDPLYLPVLCELVRIDLEFGWQRGRPTGLGEYRARFPALFADAVGLREVAFEEYRLRCQAGQHPDAADYQRDYGISPEAWPVPPSGSVSGACQLDARDGRGLNPRRPDAPAAFPEPGEAFLSFQLLGELGRGAFGRVYLARQDDLAGRLVALKVAPSLYDESRTLAQLQHTNIVPVHSVHRRGSLQAVCMPFLGTTTLADVLRDLHARPALPTQGRDFLSTVHSRTEGPPSEPKSLPPADPSGAHELPRHVLEKLNYVEAVLWVGARLADGLAHAHCRGIVHRDLKPANVLITDEGQPMLLDFNLSEDLKVRHAATQVGGTLPYMSPEQLDAFAGHCSPLDGRSDIYSLGLILFELLAGRPPFPAHKGRASEILNRMLADRRRIPPLRRLNPAVSPAVQAVVRRCLEPDPARRYATACQLREDLERQMEHRPLLHTREPSLLGRAAKWLRRHPRLTSAGSVATAAFLIVIALLVAMAGWGLRLRQFEAREQLAQFRRDLPAVQFQVLSGRVSDPGHLAEGAASCRTLLARYRVPDDPAWTDAPAVAYLPADERERLRDDVGQLLMLWAAAEMRRAGQSTYERAEAASRALPLIDAAEAALPEGRRRSGLSRQRAALGLPGAGETARTLPEPADARDLAMLAGLHLAEGRPAEALPLLELAVAREPGDVWVWFEFGLCQESLGRDSDAVASFGTCVALAPEFAPFAFKRGAALVRLGRHDRACADLDSVLARQPDLTEAWFHRALAHEGLKRYREAVSDATEALARGGDSARLYLLRADLRARLGDADGAARDRKQGLALKPGGELDWVARAVARMVSAPADALDDLEHALAVNPRSVPALQNKAYILSELLGRPEEAVASLDRLLEAVGHFVPARAGRAVLLARLGRRAEAIADVEKCLNGDAAPIVLYQAACVYALTSRQQPADALEAMALLRLALRRGFGRELIANDPDLTPLRGQPEFSRLAAQPQAKERKAP